MDKPEHYSKIVTGRSSLGDWLNKNYHEFYTYLIEKYKDIDLKTSLYMYYNNIESIPLCTCGDPVKFHGYKYGFSKFCCPSCAGKNEEVKTKLKNTILEKYGEDYMSKFIDKGKKTKVLKYGDSNYNNKNKIKQTCLEKYGVDNPMKLESFKLKSKQTCLEKYGSEYYLKSQQYLDIKDLCIEKSKQTCLEKYGVPCVMTNNDIKNKVKQTCLEKYGVEWNCMRKESRNQRNFRSKPNENFANILDSLGVSYEREFYLNGKSFDFKINNTLIEINPSPTHNINWNPYGGKIIDKYYHLHKTELAKSNNYNIINVWDWDDVNKILYILKPKTTIYARLCEVKPLRNSICNEFLNKYHIQNSCKGQSVKLGLYYNDELVSVMTFGKPRYNKNYEWELLRLCYHPNYKVVGGSEKLFNYFINNQQPNNIISYCDNSKFNGSVYNRLGFILKNKNSNPSKHWYNCKTNIHITDNLLRQKGFDQLFQDNLGKGTNNEELMRENGFIEIYDAGQSAFEWKNIKK